MLIDKKSKDIEALYKTQNGNIYKVNKNQNSISAAHKKSLLAKAKLFKKRESNKIKSALDVGGDIYVTTDSSMDNEIDPI